MCTLYVLLDCKRDGGVVGRTVHSVLYALLINYRVAEAVLLAELALCLDDVRLMAAAICNLSDDSLADILSSHCQV